MNLQAYAVKAISQTWLATGTTMIMVTALLIAAGCASTANQTEGAQGSAKVPSEQKLAMNAAMVLRNQMERPSDQRIPDDLINGSRCIAVFPSVVKVGFIVGGKRGHGLVSCRKQGAGSWSDAAPAYYTLTSGSIGLQAGAQSSQLILLFLNDRGVDNLLKDDIKFGTDISIAAGPVGYNASIKGAPAPVVSYQTSTKGLFAGINLGGSTLSFDKDSNQQVYQKVVTDPGDVLFNTSEVPGSVDVFNQALDTFAPSAKEQPLNESSQS